MKKRKTQDATSISLHYIRNSIRSVYARRLVMPVLLLLLMLTLWQMLPISSLISPQKHSALDLVRHWEHLEDEYVNTDLESLYFTGYTSSIRGNTVGYYYYTMIDDECLIVVLSPETCEEGLPEIAQLNISCKISTPDQNLERLITRLADDIQWTHSGLSNQMSDIYLEEPSFSNTITYLFFGIYAVTFSYALLYSVLCILAILIPTFSPPCMHLDKFGSASELLAQAEEELATLPQLATEDMFITENFFIEISKYGVAIVPIKEIIWVYKHSTLHKFLHYHFVISYTLHIVGNKGFYIQCPKNIKSNIDGIIDYLAEANHDILVGFNENNRLKVQEIQRRRFRFEKLVQFLQKRI